MTKLTSTKELNKFHDALLGKIPYSSEYDYIKNVEHFLICWLNGFVGDDFQCEYTKAEGESYIQHMYIHFTDDFTFNGTLYRGMSLLKNSVMKNDYLTSFTSNLEIAADFAHPLTDKHESHLFKVNVDRAFDFSRFLSAIGEKSTCEDFEIVLLDRLFEEEKLHIFDLEKSQRLSLQEIEF